MPVADFHVHTTNSDGTLALSELPVAARRAGVEAVAVTDHDRVHPGLDGPVEERDGVTVVHGIELRVNAPTQHVDLLGFGLSPTTELRQEVERIQRNRVERGRKIVECVESRLEVDLDVEIREGIGRPHIARAIADHPDTEYDFSGAFEHLVGDDSPCYVARDVPSFERGEELLSGSCALVGLAHPLRYEEPEAAIETASDLDAIERWYPYDDDPDPGPVEAAIDRHGLLPTGGSDAHDETLGVAGMPREAYEAVRKRLPEPVEG